MEDILQMADFRGFSASEDNCNDVKADPFQGNFSASGKVLGASNDVEFLIPVNIAFRQAKIRVGPRLHFHHNQRRAFRRNDIQFAGPGRRPIVSRDDVVPLALQVPVRDILTPAA